MRRARRICYASLIAWTIAPVGCRNTQTPMSNPFLTPDRVPPPATRVLSPGTAQPYYPGDAQLGGAFGAGTPVIGSPVPPTLPSYGGVSGPLPTTAYPPANYGSSIPAPSNYGTPSYSPPTYSTPTYGPSNYAPGTTYAPGGIGPGGSVAPGGGAIPYGTPPASGTPYSAGPNGAPTTPPGGWGRVGQLFAPTLSAPGDSIRIPSDSLSSRFAQGDGNGTLDRRIVTAGIDDGGLQTSSNSSAPAASSSVFQAGGAFEASADTRGRVVPAGWIDPSVPAASQSETGPSPVAPARIVESARLRSVRADDSLRSDNSLSTLGNWARAGEADTQQFVPPQRVPSLALTSSQLPSARVRGSATPNAGDARAHRFGADANYRALRGRLDYQAESGQWTIVYLSPDGRSDAYGGSVLVANPQSLGDLRPGDFVAVQGKLLAGEVNAGSFAPLYQVASVQRQR